MQRKTTAGYDDYIVITQSITAGSVWVPDISIEECHNCDIEITIVINRNNIRIGYEDLNTYFPCVILDKGTLPKIFSENEFMRKHHYHYEKCLFANGQAGEIHNSWFHIYAGHKGAILKKIT